MPTKINVMLDNFNMKKVFGYFEKEYMIYRKKTSKTNTKKTPKNRKKKIRKKTQNSYESRIKSRIFVE